MWVNQCVYYIGHDVAVCVYIFLCVDFFLTYIIYTIFVAIRNTSWFNPKLLVVVIIVGLASSNGVGTMDGSRVPDSAVDGCEFKTHCCHLTVHKPDSLVPAFKKCVLLL